VDPMARGIPPVYFAVVCFMREILFVSVVPKFFNFTSFSKDILAIFLLSNHSAAQNGMSLPPTVLSTALFLGQSVKGCTTGV